MSTVTLVFKNYSLVKLTHIRIRADKTKSALRNKMKKLMEIVQMSYTQIMVPTKKIDSNSRTSQDFFSTFSWTFCIKVLWLFLDFWRNSRTFQDFYGSCTNSNNKISFLQNKNIYPVVCINNSSFYTKGKNKYLSQYILHIIISIFHSWKLILYINFLT